MLQKADRQQRSRKQRKAIQKIHRKNPKKILPKIEELLRLYRKIHIENPKKFCQNLRSMRFLPISLPISIYVDSSPLVLYPRSRLNPLLCLRPVSVSEPHHTIRTQDSDLRHTVLQTTCHYSTHLPLLAYAACGCRAY